MKMKDVFDIPVINAGKRLIEYSSNECGLFNLPNESKAAAHAINCHDELVEALANIENDDGRTPPAIWELRNKALAKARGEK